MGLGVPANAGQPVSRRLHVSTEYFRHGNARPRLAELVPAELDLQWESDWIDQSIRQRLPAPPDLLVLSVAQRSGQPDLAKRRACDHLRRELVPRAGSLLERSWRRAQLHLRSEFAGPRSQRDQRP